MATEVVMLFNSPVDIALVLGIALVVFGPKKLPELGKSVGEGLKNFKRAMSDVTEEVKDAVRTEEEPRKLTTSAAGSEVKEEGGGDKADRPETVPR